MIELENKLHFKDFINEINNEKIQNLDLDINNINNDIINQIKGELKVKSYLIKLDENKLINNKNKYYIPKIEFVDDENNKIYYYNNCQIINQKVYLLLNQIDRNISTKTKLIRCALNNNKIIIFSNNNIINTGYLNKDNTFIIEHVIYSGSNKDISKIFEIFKMKGYTFIQEYLSNTKMKINYNNNLLEARIYSLLEEKERSKNISSKLKALVLLSIFNQNNVDYYKNNNTEKVFLMNKDWLLQYKYDEINKLIEKNRKLKDYLNKEKISNLSIDSNKMKDIISLLDYDSLLKIDEYISKFNNKEKIPFEANHELLKLKNKTIIVYQSFIMINSDNLKMLEKYFPIPSNCQEITYLSHINGDIFIMNKNKNIKQHYILFGNINSNSYSFDIRFIFDYENSNLLKKELKAFMNIEIKNI